MAITTPLQSEGTLDYEGLITTLKYLLDASWGPEWGALSPDGPNVVDPTSVSYPIITHYLREMRPGKIGNNAREIKPRPRYHAVNEEVNGTQPPGVTIYGQVFDAEVVFEVWEDTNFKVDALAKQFRQLLTALTGYLKRKGIKEFQFVRLEAEPSNNRIKDAFKIRKLTYYVRFEEITEVPANVLQAIDIAERQLKSISNPEVLQNENGE